ncbi:NAD(P)/FAD-dependent oxidoreductase [Acuticoccus sp. MNP-M23]|uniref:NAD(P)/FAD-dependent oxidoreductase n=1 Tax=Acuticoccus sp. MNP-M23 TaxID=3072793 RepID=UPI0028162CBD|nr:NAD(P)/FAD-dependent oxidoreductase [Acuticoccus sp. MNP-M23]WMS41893.1 NAD(P)/FAD-dependent oxidoreductase [Acuticoccus sp. MNP-M23]
MAATPLDALNNRVADDLAFLQLPAAKWVPETTIDGEPVLDVAVIGGGMAGLAAAASLRFQGVEAVIFDGRPRGREGPWATTARMETLRSPKGLTGPALGIPSLTFRAWFEAQFGRAAWDALGKIPRLQWMDYLGWYRSVLGLEVRSECRVNGIVPHPDHVVLTLDTPDGAQVQRARHVVLATGRDGLGGPLLPDFAHDLPPDRWAHSSDEYDYDRLAERRVAVIGVGSSAMDSAATALESGAAAVHILVRRSDIPRTNRGMAMGNPGFVEGLSQLPDAWRWRIHSYIAEEQVPPPKASVLRVSRHDNAHFHLGCAVSGAAMKDGEVVLQTSLGPAAFDFVLFGTGFKVDWAAKDFLKNIGERARTWRHRFVPGKPGTDALLDMPDLGPAFEFLPKTGEEDGGLSRVHCYCYPALMSHGAVSGDIPAISVGAARLSEGIVAALYREDVDWHFQRGRDYDVPELTGDEWTPASADLLMPRR